MSAKIDHSESLTNFEYQDIHHLWKIKNFSMCNKKNGEFIESETFPNQDNNQCQWRLRVYPRGFDDESKDFLSVYLIFIPKEKKSVEAKVLLSIWHSKRGIPNKEISNSHTRKFSQRYNAIRFPKICKRDMLLPHLENDVLIIDCTIRLEMGVVNKPNKRIKLDKHEFQNQLINNFNQMKDSGSFSDVSLSTKDGTEFPAHKCILAARSPVFSAMFQHDMKENRESTIKIEDVDADTLKHLLHFIYTSKVDEDNCDMEALLAAADKYDIEDLKKLCEHGLVEKLKVENAVDYLLLADTHGAKTLKEQSIEFINANFKDFLKTEKMKNLPSALWYDIIKLQNK